MCLLGEMGYYKKKYNESLEATFLCVLMFTVLLLSNRLFPEGPYLSIYIILIILTGGCIQIAITYYINFIKLKAQHEKESKMTNIEKLERLGRRYSKNTRERISIMEKANALFNLVKVDCALHRTALKGPDSCLSDSTNIVRNCCLSSCVHFVGDEEE